MLTIQAKGLDIAVRETRGQLSRMNKAIATATHKQALLLERTMVLGLRDQAPGGQPILPLSDMTIMLRALRKMKTKVVSKKPKSDKALRGSTKTAALSWLAGVRPMRKAKRSGAVARGMASGGSTKALIDHGDMLRSIHTEKVTAAHFTVGVHKGARDKQGKSMDLIAAVHEYGSRHYTMTVTVKMARFSRFLCVMGVLRVPWRVGQVLKRKVPARPFLRPAHAQWEPGAGERFNVDFSYEVFRGSGFTGMTRTESYS